MNKSDKIKLLITLSNTKSLSRGSFQQMLSKMDYLSDEVKEQIVEKFHIAAEHYEAEQVAVYDKWLSEEAIDGAIAFYNSPVGQEVLNNMPHIMHALCELGYKNMRNIFDDIELGIPEDDSDIFGNGEIGDDFG